MSYWRQQAYSKWLKEGDANTGLFHKVMNMRRSINTIHTLTSTEGTLVGGANIQHHIRYRFKDLFGKATANRIEMTHEQRYPIVDLHVLENDFSEEEVSNAVWNLRPNKAPSLDGFPLFFYRTF